MEVDKTRQSPFFQCTDQIRTAFTNFFSLLRSQLTSLIRYPVWQHTFVSFSAFSRRAVVSYWRKYVHEVLVNRLGGLSLPRKSVVRLTDRPDMTLDVYCGRKTTKQQSYNNFTDQSRTKVTNRNNNVVSRRRHRYQCTSPRTTFSLFRLHN